jgi:hypothetical protein
LRKKTFPNHHNAISIMATNQENNRPDNPTLNDAQNNVDQNSPQAQGNRNKPSPDHASNDQDDIYNPINGGTDAGRGTSGTANDSPFESGALIEARDANDAANTAQRTREAGLGGANRGNAKQS